MNRRQLLKLLALGVAGHTLDIDRLLWVPNTRKIFLPSPGLSISQIVALELERITPQIKTLFERDDTFYRSLSNRRVPVISSRDIRIPLVIGVDWGKDVTDSFRMGRNVSPDATDGNGIEKPFQQGKNISGETKTKKPH